MELINQKDISRELDFLHIELKKAKFEHRFQVSNYHDEQVYSYLHRLNRFHKNESLKCENYLSFIFQEKTKDELYQFISSREFLIKITNFSDFDVDAVSKFIVDYYSFYDTKHYKTNEKVIFDIQ